MVRVTPSLPLPLYVKTPSWGSPTIPSRAYPSDVRCNPQKLLLCMKNYQLRIQGKEGDVSHAEEPGKGGASWEGAGNHTKERKPLWPPPSTQKASPTAAAAPLGHWCVPGVPGACDNLEVTCSAATMTPDTPKPSAATHTGNGGRPHCPVWPPRTGSTSVICRVLVTGKLNI